MKRSEWCFEHAFLAAAWPPFLIVDLLRRGKGAPEAGLLWGALLGILLLPITGIVVFPLYLAGKIISLFEKNEKEK